MNPAITGGIFLGAYMANFPPRGAGNESLNSDGGQKTVAVPINATTVISAVPGRLCRIMVTTLGAGVPQFFDDPATGQGTIIATLPASAAIGPQQVIDMPFAKGCVCVNPSNGPVMTVSVITS